MRIEQAKESRDIAALTKEFTQRLSLVENQLREAVQVEGAINHCSVNFLTFVVLNHEQSWTYFHTITFLL